MLVDADNRRRVTDELPAELRNMHQAVFLDAHIHETAEVGDVRHDAGQHHAYLQVVDGLHVLVELEFLDGLSRVTSGFLQFLHDVGQGRETHLVGHVFLDVNFTS